MTKTTSPSLHKPEASSRNTIQLRFGSEQEFAAVMMAAADEGAMADINIYRAHGSIFLCVRRQRALWFAGVLRRAGLRKAKILETEYWSE